MAGEIDNYEIDYEERTEYQFSVWYLEGSGARWLDSRIKGNSPVLALKAALKNNHYVGLYFVCDPGSNPNGVDSYGATTFWVDEYKNISLVRDIQHVLLDIGRGIKVETIEI